MPREGSDYQKLQNPLDCAARPPVQQTLVLSLLHPSRDPGCILVSRPPQSSAPTATVTCFLENINPGFPASLSPQVKSEVRQSVFTWLALPPTPALRGRGRGMSMGSRPAWSTQPLPTHHRRHIIPLPQPPGWVWGRMPVRAVSVPPAVWGKD